MCKRRHGMFQPRNSSSVRLLLLLQHHTAGNDDLIAQDLLCHLYHLSFEVVKIKEKGAVHHQIKGKIGQQRKHVGETIASLQGTWIFDHNSPHFDMHSSAPKSCQTNLQQFLHTTECSLFYQSLARLFTLQRSSAPLQSNVNRCYFSQTAFC